MPGVQTFWGVCAPIPAALRAPLESLALSFAALGRGRVPTPCSVTTPQLWTRAFCKGQSPFCDSPVSEAGGFQLHN